MKFDFILSSKPSLEHTAPPQAHPSGAAQLLALTPGKWSVHVLRWKEGKTERFSAINSWADQGKWVCYFYYGPFHPAIPLALTGVGNSAEKSTAQEAFAAFPQGLTILIAPSDRGPTYPVPILFTIPTDFYYEGGEIRVELEWLGFT